MEEDLKEQRERCQKAQAELEKDCASLLEATADDELRTLRGLYHYARSLVLGESPASDAASRAVHPDDVEALAIRLEEEVKSLRREESLREGVRALKARAAVEESELRALRELYHAAHESDDTGSPPNLNVYIDPELVGEAVRRVRGLRGCPDRERKLREEVVRGKRYVEEANENTLKYTRDFQALQDSLEDSQDSVRKLEDEVEEKEAEVERLSATIRGLERSAVDVSEERGEMERARLEHALALNDLRGRLSVATRDKAGLDARVEELRKELERKERALTTKAHALRVSQERLRRLVGEVNEVVR